MHSDLDDLDVVLASADKDTLAEIVRQAESFLAAQLQAGIAADQRAITFASVIAAVIAVLLGGYLTAAYSDNGAGNLAWIVLPATFGLLTSACIAAYTSRPTDWCYAGSNPRHWRDDVTTKTPHGTAVAGQAKLYAKGIIGNKAVLNKNAGLMWTALIVAGVSVLTGVATTAGLVMSGCL